MCATVSKNFNLCSQICVIIYMCIHATMAMVDISNSNQSLNHCFKYNTQLNSHAPQNWISTLDTSKNSIMNTEPKDSIWNKYRNTLLELGSPDSFIYSVNDDKKGSPRFFPEVGNGHFATQINNEYIFMNGLYNGAGVHSHRAAIPSTINWSVKPKTVNTTFGNWTHTLNAAIGVFISRGEFPEFSVEVITYAARMQKHLLVREIRVTMATDIDTLVLQVDQAKEGFFSPDLNITVMRTEWIFEIRGLTKIPETVESRVHPVVVIGDIIPSKLTFTKVVTSRTFITAIGREFDVVKSAYINGREIMSILLDEQVNGWMRLWRHGRVSVTPENTSQGHFLASVTHASQYYLLTSLPWPTWDLPSDWPFFGLSPGGLAHGNSQADYQGHVFWDMETWMFPTLLLLHPKLAEKMLLYRNFTLPGVKDRAKKDGYQGARYPSESGFTGYEVCPWSLGAVNEIYVTGAVSLAVQQYLWTQPTATRIWYETTGKVLLEETARFWRSRMVLNKVTSEYEILGVICPDEYSHVRNNSAFTNSVARISLLGPLTFYRRYHPEANASTIPKDYKEWFDVAQHIRIPLDTIKQVVLEYDGYVLGTRVKQADVVMLTYPVQYPLTRNYKQNNFLYYENVTDLNGPAMTWSIFSIGLLELGNSEKAWNLFQRNFDFVQPPFHIWSEIRGGLGAINFLTGMGGFLQSLLNGYGGVRIKEEHLVINPTLLPTVKQLIINGIKFQGSSVRIVIGNDSSVGQSTNKQCYLSILLIEGQSLDIKTSLTNILMTLSPHHNTITLVCQKLLIGRSQ